MCRTLFWGTFFNRSEIKEGGWFTSSQPVQDQITPEKKAATPRRSSRTTVTPRAMHQPTRLTLPPPTHLTHLELRSINPTVRRPAYTTNEIKVYSRHDVEDENSELTLPPTTTALVVKKPVK